MTDTVSRLSSSLADRYRIERELGQGGMATVYLAHDVRHDRKVALKLLRPELAAILGGERFLKEIRTTANLQHPHILALHDSGEADGLIYYVMPYIDGESLRDRLNREKQLPVDDCVRIAREVADALHYAHQHGIVHRDIKPENILLQGGHALVADFGIALAASKTEGGTRMTETGMSLGTPHYMAPEQAMGEKEITPKADIYALGCVAYEMLTAEPPFTGATAQAIVARVMTEQPRSLTMQRRTIPPNVEAAVQKALEKLPADRFGSAAEFADALGRAGFAVAGPRASPAVTGPAGTRSRVAAAIPWVLLVAAAGIAAAGWLRSTPQVVDRQRIVLWDRTIITPGSLSRGLAISPEGRTVVFLDTVGGVQQLWAKDRDQLDPVPISGTAGITWAPEFSPDGAWIAFVSDGKLKKVPRLGGSAVTLADTVSPLYPSVAWLDNDSLVFNTASFNLKVVGADGGPARTVWRADTVPRAAVNVTALPNGAGVLAGTCSPGCTEIDLRGVNLRTGEVKLLVEQVIRGWHTGDGHVVFVRRDGGVFRVPFDLETMAFSAAPLPVLSGVRTTTGRADFILGRNGSLIYVAGTAQSEGIPTHPVWVTREGAAAPIDTAWTMIPSANFGAALSPDGRRLALSLRNGGSADIWVKELPAGPITRLTFAGTNIRPEWTADGRSIMYIASRGGNEDLMIRRADGTGTEETVLDAGRTVFEVRRTRDTSQLIVRLGVPPTRDIYLLRRGDTAATKLIADDGHEEVSPALSPDGRWLAYSSNESGRYEVYVRPFPDVNAGRWQVSRNGGTEPQWAHSGRELFYRDPGGLVAATIRPGSGFVTAEQRRLFATTGFMSGANHAVYAVAPDDRRFVFFRQAGATAAQGPLDLIRVDHWLSELQRTAGRR